MRYRLVLVPVIAVLTGLACNLPAIPGLGPGQPAEQLPPPAATEAAPPPAAATDAGPAAPDQPPTPTPDDPRDQVAIVRIQTVVNEAEAEYVELANLGTVPQLMDGWKLKGSLDNEDLFDDFTFPAGFALQPGASVKVHSGPNGLDAPPTDLFWTEQDIWDNAGETIYLFNPQLDLVDSFDWPPAGNE